jgi:hypothetical protein
MKGKEQFIGTACSGILGWDGVVVSHPCGRKKPQGWGTGRSRWSRRLKSGFFAALRMTNSWEGEVRVNGGFFVFVALWFRMTKL